MYLVLPWTSAQHSGYPQSTAKIFSRNSFVRCFCWPDTTVGWGSPWFPNDRFVRSVASEKSVHSFTPQMLKPEVSERNGEQLPAEQVGVLRYTLWMLGELWETTRKRTSKKALSHLGGTLSQMVISCKKYLYIYITARVGVMLMAGFRCWKWPNNSFSIKKKNKKRLFWTLHDCKARDGLSGYMMDMNPVT